MTEASSLPPGRSNVYGFSSPGQVGSGQTEATQKTKAAATPPPLQGSTLQSAGATPASQTPESSNPDSPQLTQPQGGENAAQEFNQLLDEFFPDVAGIWEEMMEDPKLFSPETAKRIKEMTTSEKQEVSDFEVGEDPGFTDEEFMEAMAKLLGPNKRAGELKEGEGGVGEEETALETDGEATDAEFRFAGNYLKIVGQMLAFVNMMKGLIASLDGEALKKLGEAEEANTKDLIKATVDRMEKNIEQREMMKNQSDAAKWILFAAQAIATVAMTVLTAGAAAPLMAILLAATTVTLVMQAMEMAGVSVTKGLCECFGLDPEKFDWVMKLVIAVVMVVATLGAGAAAHTAKIGNVAEFTMKQTMFTVGSNVAPMAIMNSNLVYELTMRIAMEAGMDEEDAAFLAMALSMITMVIMMVACCGLNPKYGVQAGPKNEGVSSAARQGSQKGSTVKEQLNKKLTNFQKKWDKMSSSEKASMIELGAQVVQAAGGIANAVASIQQAILTEIRADLQYDIAVLDAFRELMSTLQAMFGETRQGILQDLESNMFKFSAELHKMFDKMITDASQIVSEAGSAVR